MVSRPLSKRAWIAAAAALWFLALEPAVARHEIPVDITVQILVRPEADTLRVLIRVPLRAMRDVEFPQRGPGFLVIDQAERELRDAAQLWLGDEIRFFEEGDPIGGQEILRVQVSLPSNRDFRAFDDALAHIRGPPLPATTDLPWQNAMLDVEMSYTISSEAARFSIAPNLGRLAERVSTVLRFVSPAGETHVLQYVGDPGRVVLDPAWYQAAWHFVVMGFEHILDGIDHLLFLLCLVIPFRKLKALILIVTAFTVAHSITLIASALGASPPGLWFPPLIETLIAASILYMAIENMFGAEVGRRWTVAFGFGLVHGFGFSFALQESLQFAGENIISSLLAFNVGVELGQLAVLLLMVPLLEILFRLVPREKTAVIVLSALVAHTGWHWMTERWAVLSQYDRPWYALQGGWPVLLIAVGAAAYGWFVMYKKPKTLGPEQNEV